MVNARGEKKEGLASSLRGLTRNSSKTLVNPSETGGGREDLQVVFLVPPEVNRTGRTVSLWGALPEEAPG